jgi:hypothetical protein
LVVFISLYLYVNLKNNFFDLFSGHLIKLDQLHRIPELVWHLEYRLQVPRVPLEAHKVHLRTWVDEPHGCWGMQALVVLMGQMGGP